MSFKLPDLPYAYDALEPTIDAKTMEIHHSKHHAGYTKKLNNAIAGTELEDQTIQHILENVSRFPDAVRNNAGGYFNHSLFWRVLSPHGSSEPAANSDIYKAIVRAFGTFNNFKEALKKAATGQFGSGWAWLIIKEPVGELAVCSSPNQDNPLMDDAPEKGIPVLGIDVWEHAYYLKYQNERGRYFDAILNIINWEEVNERYKAARMIAMNA